MSQIIALYECDDFKSYASMRPLMLTHSWYKLVKRVYYVHFEMGI